MSHQPTKNPAQPYPTSYVCFGVSGARHQFSGSIILCVFVWVHFKSFICFPLWERDPYQYINNPYWYSKPTQFVNEKRIKITHTEMDVKYRECSSCVKPMREKGFPKRISRKQTTSWSILEGSGEQSEWWMKLLFGKE